MSMPPGNNGIFRNSAYPWIVVVLGILALFSIIYIAGDYIYTSHPDTPDWVPDGCTVRKDTSSDFPRVVVRVNQFELYNTDQEIAELILIVLENESEWFESTSSRSLQKLIDIEFPGSETGVETRYLQYTESFRYERHRYELRIRSGSKNLYVQTLTSPDDLDLIADGEKTVNLIPALTGK